MVNGEVIASDAPEAIRTHPEVQVAYLGEGTEHALAPAPSNTYYGESHVLRGVDLHIPERTARRPARPQRHGQDDADPHADGLRAGGVGPGAVARQRRDGRAARAHGAPRHRLRARRPRHLPEPLGAREPARLGARRQRRPARVDLRSRAGHLPAPRRAAGERRPAALRRRAADALDRPRADDQPEPDDPRRSDRRPGAADRRRDLARRRRHPRQRHQHADRRPQLPRRAGAHRPGGGDGEGPHRARRSVGVARRRSPTRWRGCSGV